LLSSFLFKNNFFLGKKSKIMSFHHNEILIVTNCLIYHDQDLVSERGDSEY